MKVITVDRRIRPNYILPLKKTLNRRIQVKVKRTGKDVSCDH